MPKQIKTQVEKQIETKEVILVIRDYQVKGDKRKKIAPFSAAMVEADITVKKDDKLERFKVVTPLDSDPTFAKCIQELVSQAVQLKWPELQIKWPELQKDAT